MGRHLSARPFALLTCLLVLVGCASTAPAPTSSPTPEVPADGPVYLEGIRSEYSVPIASLGDVELLGRESVMRDALVAGDQELLVAATAFRVDDVLTLDLVVLNKSGETVDLARSDLHLFDAQGRLIPQMEDVDEGIAWGLRGRGQQASEGQLASNHDVFSPTWGLDAAQLGLETPRAQPTQTKRETAVETSRRNDDELRRVEEARPVTTTAPFQLTSSPRSVRVRPDDGKVFWAYFSGEEPEYPVTAMVLIDKEQYLFRFDH